MALELEGAQNLHVTVHELKSGSALTFEERQNFKSVCFLGLVTYIFTSKINKI